MYIDLKSKLQTAPEMSFHLGSKAEENAVLAAVIDVENQVVQAPAGRAPNRIVTFHTFQFMASRDGADISKRIVFPTDESNLIEATVESIQLHRRVAGEATRRQLLYLQCKGDFSLLQPTTYLTVTSRVTFRVSAPAPRTSLSALPMASSTSSPRPSASCDRSRLTIPAPLRTCDR